MWSARVYEWLAAERIALYHQEAARDRRRREAARPEIVGRAFRREQAPTRRALAAAFIGLAAIGVLRRRR